MSRRIRTGIAALTLVGGALLGSFAMTSPASAGGQNGLVNVTVTDVANGNQVVVLQNVAVPVAAAVCGVNAVVLSTQLANGQPAACPALSGASQIASVVKA